MKIPVSFLDTDSLQNVRRQKNEDVKLGKQRTELFFNTLLEVLSSVCMLCCVVCVCVDLQVCAFAGIKIHL